MLLLQSTSSASLKRLDFPSFAKRSCIVCRNLIVLYTKNKWTSYTHIIEFIPGDEHLITLMSVPVHRKKCFANFLLCIV